MSTLEICLKQSFIVRFSIALIGVLSQSFIARVVEAIAKVILESRIGYCLRTIASRPYFQEGSLVYLFFNGLNKKSAPFRDKCFLILKESSVYKLLFASRYYVVIASLLVPSVAFYAYIDELGRDILGGFALFGVWDEAFLLLCALYVFCDWFFNKQHKPLSSTPVSTPMILLISMTFYLYLVNTTHSQLGVEGFRVVVQYMLWFFVMNSYLDDDKKAYLVTRLLVYSGGAMGIHGILQFVLKVDTPAHWTDRAEGATATRVFSIVGSPNILGSIFILMIPLCLSLVLQNNRKFSDRMVFFVLLGAMGLSLVLTLSRGAWFGAAVALFIFCLAINPRWLILLGAGGSTMLFIPSVMNRIQYMLSPQYIISSSTGGRLMRYEKGWELYQQNKLMGVGLGHFGGAVAMNNKKLVPNTFYMDNYWLKSIVEMGTIGLIAFAILVGALILWSIRSVKLCKDYDCKLVTAGGFAGLCGVIAHNFFENVFEVPYMVVYFWVIASIVLYFGLRRKRNTN